MIGKDGGARRFGCGGFQLFLQIVAVEDVIAQHQRAIVAADKLFAEDKGLGQTVRAWLHFILQIQAPLAAVAQQLLEARRILRGADDQDIADTSQHQGAQRVVDHRFVVDWQQLFAHRHGDRIETSP